METLTRDLRDAWRTVRRHPGYALLVVVTLALGIGPTTAVWSMLDAFVLRPLPFAGPVELVVVEKLHETTNRQFRRRATEVSIPAFRDLYARQRIFSGLACYLESSFNLGGHGPRGEGGPERVIGAQVSDRFFEVLGTPPLHGRFFVPGEDQGNVPRVAVLGHRLFERRFGGDASIVGRTIQVDREPYRVVGVLPAGFELPTQAEIWVPLHPRILAWSRFNENMTMIARLRAGVGTAAAAAQMSAVAWELQARHPEPDPYGFGVRPLKPLLFPELRRLSLILTATVLMVLVITCANVAHFAAARAVGRQREMAIRAACGADRRRLLRQLLTENVLLAVGGGVLGLGIAFLGVRGFDAAVPVYLPAYLEASVDGRLLLFSLALSVAAGVFFGSLPARIAARPELFPLLKEGGAEGGTPAPAPAGQRRRRRTFVVVQATLALVLLIVAGSLIQEVRRLRSVDPGFAAESVLALRISISRPRYPRLAQVALFCRELLERLETIPGVESAGAASTLPILEETSFTNFRLKDMPEIESVLYTIVSPGYFRSLGTPSSAAAPSRKSTGEVRRTPPWSTRAGCAGTGTRRERKARRFWESASTWGSTGAG